MIAEISNVSVIGKNLTGLVICHVGVHVCSCGEWSTENSSVNRLSAGVCCQNRQHTQVNRIHSRPV